jgi:ribosomal protein L11 methyltransferase
VSNYTLFKISSKPFLPDLISGIMWELEINGISEEENRLLVFISEDSPVDSTLISKKMEKLKEEGIIKSYSMQEESLEDKNWNELWEQSREVIKIVDRVVIKPSFKEYERIENEIVLTIDPKMSFGTGEHQSTKIVIHLMEKYVKQDMKVLDVGSGTGILSLAAVKLGALKAIAVDNDNICYENCIENCRVNNESDRIQVIEGTIKDVEEIGFELILANIQKNILMEIADEISNKIKKGGIVILSGLMIGDESEVISRYKTIGFDLVETKTMDEWIGIVFKK